ncbi:GNAT family N-acetyltransferase [Granulicoccus phenolivorans]|uniref:GNAT family N-acetyltransferase n=1 Tax=Granulicoccus phenolivorans TaxID=266854 RepID=UPI000419EBBC|nr:GNAT family N-acetyltransferase [Granulicoccus phenolivorans]
MTGALTLRPGLPGDLAAIMELERAGFAAAEQWSERSWSDELAAGHRLILLATAGAEVLGVATFQHIAGVADLNRIIVAPAARGAGIGRTLVEAGAGTLAATGNDQLLLEVERHNTAARALYAATGFVPIATRSDYYGPGRDAIIMRRDLGEENHE